MAASLTIRMAAVVEHGARAARGRNAVFGAGQAEQNARELLGRRAARRRKWRAGARGMTASATISKHVALYRF